MNKRKEKKAIVRQSKYCMLHTTHMKLKWTKPIWIWKHGKNITRDIWNEWVEKKPNTERAMADQPKTIAMNLNSIQHQNKWKDGLCSMLHAPCSMSLTYMLGDGWCKCGLTMAWS